ncbi:hypothetical protein C5O80_01455 [Burkholderia sp. SRS-46]|nr:hypothetical protein C5O80_01455 [Burkholderia sp. SRS-46]
MSTGFIMTTHTIRFCHPHGVRAFGGAAHAPARARRRDCAARARPARPAALHRRRRRARQPARASRATNRGVLMEPWLAISSNCSRTARRPCS